jgi:hypothetical protein
MYALILVGLGMTIWPGVINHSLTSGHSQSVVSSLLAAVAVLAAVGIRYPLALLPLLFFELVWKVIWLVAFALPLWQANQIDAATVQTIKDCVPAIILLLAIPWRYVYAHYLKKRGERWR